MGQHHNMNTIHPILDDNNCYNTMGSMPHGFVLIVAPSIKEDNSLLLHLFLRLSHSLLPSQSLFQKSHFIKTTFSLPNAALSEKRHIQNVPCPVYQTGASRLLCGFSRFRTIPTPGAQLEDGSHSVLQPHHRHQNVCQCPTWHLQQFRVQCPNQQSQHFSHHPLQCSNRQ